MTKEQMGVNGEDIQKTDIPKPDAPIQLEERERELERKAALNRRAPASDKERIKTEEMLQAKTERKKDDKKDQKQSAHVTQYGKQ